MGFYRIWTEVRFSWRACASRCRRRHKIVAALLLLPAALFFVLFCMQARCHHYYFPGWYPTVTATDNTDVTVVTAYFNLGSFQKGDGHSPLTYTPKGYFQLAANFRYLQNPLVVYTDSKEFDHYFKTQVMDWNNRQKVRVVVIDRGQLPAFGQYMKQLKIIFDDPTYPKFHPNTVSPEYASSQHAKVDVVENAMIKNYFLTKYYAWVDLGYFQNIAFRKRKFWLVVPEKLTGEEIAITEVQSPDFSLTPRSIFESNLYWVGGGMVLGSRKAYKRYIKDYRQALRLFLGQSLANTDQQVIYSMFCNVGRHQLPNVSTQLHTYSWVLIKFRACWYDLGYICYREV